MGAGDPAPLAPQTPLEPPQAPPTNLRRKKEERGGGRRKKRGAPLKLNPASATVFTNNERTAYNLWYILTLEPTGVPSRRIVLDI